MPDVLGAKVAAVFTNAITFLFAFSLVLVWPLVRGISGLWSRPEVRVWSIVAVLVFGAQSLLWTLHSTRGSYFHSLGAFYPFGVAIAVAGGAAAIGPFLAIDAAAWRWLSGRSVIVTPADGLDAATCMPGAGWRSIVLEEAHFAAYDDLYRGVSRPDWLGAPVVRGGVKIFPVIAPIPPRCVFG